MSFGFMRASRTSSANTVPSRAVERRLEARRDPDGGGECGAKRGGIPMTATGAARGAT